MECQPQKLQRLETCYADVFSTRSTLRRITAYFCFSKKLDGPLTFTFLAVNLKRTKTLKTVDGLPPSHLVWQLLETH